MAPVAGESKAFETTRSVESPLRKWRRPI